MPEKVTIGNAELWHGDCREIEIADGSIDMIFTDPPYGHNNNNNGDLISNLEKALGKANWETHAPRPIANDGKEKSEALVRWLFASAKRWLKRGAVCCCCCCGGGPDPQFARWGLWLNEHLDFKQMIVWDKGPMGLGWHYRRSYEVVLVAQQPGAACAWYDQTDKIENIIRPGAYGIGKIIPTAADHPTPKPPALVALFINLHSQAGDVVFDPFMGGGSTGIVAVRMGRRFVGVELDRRWFDLACERIDAAQRQAPLFEFQVVKPEQVAMVFGDA